LNLPEVNVHGDYMARRIVHTPYCCSGAPRIEDTRLTCANIVTLLTSGELSLTEFLEVYPYLTIADVEECARYCAARRCVEDQVLNYCQGCSLDERVNVDDDSGANQAESDLDLDELALPALDDTPVDGWILAAQLLEKLEEHNSHEKENRG
jgi:uncharacterized protein (DUF433 family)